MGNRRDYLISEIVRICKKLDEKGFGGLDFSGVIKDVRGEI